MKKNIITACLLLAACTIANAQGFTTLGIGITSPTGTLHVHSDAQIIPPINPRDSSDNNEGRDLNDPPVDYNTILRVTNGNTGTGTVDGFVVNQYNYGVTLQQYEEGNLIIKNHDADLVLSSGGRVGIGAVDNLYKFNVVGTARVTSGLSVGGSVICNGGASISGTLTANNGNFSGTLRIGNGFNCDALGALKVKSLRVTLTGWADHVFGEGYRLMPLSEVERYIGDNGHLPEVPSAAEVEAEGVDMGEMNRLLLQKVEELTLYVIDLQKQLDELKSNK